MLLLVLLHLFDYISDDTTFLQKFVRVNKIYNNNEDIYFLNIKNHGLL